MTTPTAKCILLVEDNPVNAELVTDILEVGGYVVLQAATAEAGIALARAEQPDLILMDIQLPGMDGLSATRLLKSEAQTQAIPVVALTAQAMMGDEARALAAGCIAYMSKPIDTRELPRLVARLLSSPVSDA